MYSFILTALRKLGFKKTAVRTAYFMERRAKDIYNSRSFDAAQVFLYGANTGFPTCSECQLPILSGTEEIHELCRQAIQRDIDESDRAWAEYQAELEAESAADEAASQAYLNSRCRQHGCWDEAVKDGYCQADWDYNFLCKCGQLESVCRGDCYFDEQNAAIDSEPDEPYGEYDDHQEEEDECPGGCGQPANCCTCAELASWKRYLATPMEERDGIWTA